jgi:hypothetical protein
VINDKLIVQLLQSCMYGINDKINLSLVIIENLITTPPPDPPHDREVKQLSIQRT